MRRCRIGLLLCGFVLTAALLALTSSLVLPDPPGGKLVPDADTSRGDPCTDGLEPTDHVFSSTETIKRYVTPSLAELGERGIPSEKNEHVLMVTRVPGAGSELLVLMLQRLQGYNAFKHIRLPPGDEGILSSLQQELLVEEVTDIIRKEAIPLSFDGDVRFLNFSTFGRQAPMYISLVRDPLDPKTLERFKKGDASTIYRGSIAHFCGHDSRCSVRNNVWALEQAKANVLKWYPVVGVLDRMDEMVDRLEKAFPYFFEGASIVFEKIRPKKRNTVKSTTTLKPVSRKRLREYLKTEVEFYDWIKSRLLNSTSGNG